MSASSYTIGKICHRTVKIDLINFISISKKQIQRCSTSHAVQFPSRFVTSHVCCGILNVTINKVKFTNEKFIAHVPCILRTHFTMKNGDTWNLKSSLHLLHTTTQCCMEHLTAYPVILLYEGIPIINIVAQCHWNPVSTVITRILAVGHLKNNVISHVGISTYYYTHSGFFPTLTSRQYFVPWLFITL